MITSELRKQASAVRLFDWKYICSSVGECIMGREYFGYGPKVVSSNPR